MDELPGTVRPSKEHPDRTSAAVLLSDGIHEGFESAFDRLYRILISQGCIDISAQVGGHLAAGFADDQHVVLPFQPDEVPRLEDHVIAWHGQFRLAMVSKIVILGEKKDAANRPSRRLFDLIEYRTARYEVRLPVQYFSAEAEQIALDGRGRQL
jgi:hypothetical protein